MGGRRHTIAVTRYATHLRDLLGDFFFGQNTAMTRLRALAHFDFNHFHIGQNRLLGKFFRVELAFIGAATKIAAAQFPHQITTTL